MSDEKRFPSTPQQRAKAIQEFGLPRSPELGWATIAIGALLMISFWGQPLGHAALQLMRSALSANHCGTLAPSEVEELRDPLSSILIHAGALLIGIWILACGAQLVQGGWVWRPRGIQPRGSRPLSQGLGASRISGASCLAVLLTVIKILAVSAVAVVCFWSSREGLFANSRLTGQNPIATQVDHLVLWLSTNATWIIAISGILGLTDYLWRRWRFSRSLLLSEVEFREVLRELPGNSAVRRLRRKRGSASNR